MKLPLSWIKEIIDINMPPHEIAKVLTSAGLEVDAFEPTNMGFENVVVGRVETVTRHPDAEKLCVAMVSDGKESFQVVCGAPNCREGIKTAFAKVGAKITDESGKVFKIKKSKLRGVESHGMLCAAQELGIGDSSDGIIEFDAHLPEGADIADMYSDVIFEISLTPNLGHCASVIGVARELSAATGIPIKLPLIYVKENEDDLISKNAKVKIEDKERCPRYACRVIKNVKVGPSPQWLQQRLEACDLRPVNNIVDITNYVLMEMGHPLHAFDYDQVEGSEVIVRTAKEGEKFTTLDDKERILSSEDLLISDQKRGIAIAGVMGGQNSEVGDDTKSILLESAYFQPATIRKTSKKFALQTEASRRYERGCDPNILIKALDRATMMIVELAGGEVCEGVIDEKTQEFPEKVISCRLSRINQMLGTQLSLSEVETAFQRLEFISEWDGKDTFSVTVPTYRVDITGEIDLVEEAARIYGYENIPKVHARFTASTLPHSPIFLFEREMRRRLIGERLQELVTCDLIGPTLYNIAKESVMPEEMCIRVLNPTSIEQSVLRTSLLPGFLQIAKFNADHQVPDMSGFEVGRIHFKKGEEYIEHSMAGIILTGQLQATHWDQKPKEVDFFDLKGIIENLMDELGVDKVSFAKSSAPSFHPGRQASILVDSREVGTFGEIHPTIIRRLDVKQRIYFAEIDLHELFNLILGNQQMKALPIYPSSDRDLTMTVEDALPVMDLLGVVQGMKLKYLEKVSLKDVYKSEKLGKEKKNLTFNFVYRDNRKTIAQAAVDNEHARIISELESLFCRR